MWLFNESLIILSFAELNSKVQRYFKSMDEAADSDSTDDHDDEEALDFNACMYVLYLLRGCRLELIFLPKHSSSFLFSSPVSRKTILQNFNQDC